MTRSATELAAIASAAMPSLRPSAAGLVISEDTDYETAMIVDTDQQSWKVRVPLHHEASTRLETEHQALHALSIPIRTELPFHAPSVAGSVEIDGLTAFVYHHLDGRALSVPEILALSPRSTEEIGASMAAIHAIRLDAVDAAGLPSYTANEFRYRRLKELDRAAATGQIPPVLLRRWEQAMEDVSLWRFQATVVHGDMHEESLLFDEGHLRVVAHWGELHVGDPADDFAWLSAVEDKDFVAAVLDSYRKHRAAMKHIGPADDHILERATLSAEFALAQWLVQTIESGHQQSITEAISMLQTLESAVLEEEARKKAEEEAEAVKASSAGAHAVSPEDSLAASSTTQPSVQIPDSVHVPPPPKIAPRSAQASQKSQGIKNDLAAAKTAEKKSVHEAPKEPTVIMSPSSIKAPPKVQPRSAKSHLSEDQTPEKQAQSAKSA